MTLTAIITNHNYGRYIRKSIESALLYCDEVIVCDDASTDNSLEVIGEYDVKLVVNDKPSGCPVWGSNKGIELATSTHVIFLDADNWLISKPPTLDYDYVFSNIEVYREDTYVKTWRYIDVPTTAKECLAKFTRTTAMPYAWGGVWRLDFIKDLRWRRWPNTAYAADFRTAIDWLLHVPTMYHYDKSVLAFRKHDGQWSGSGGEPYEIERREAVKEAERLKVWI